MSEHLTPAPDPWTCVACAAHHAVPALRCRRCGADLLMTARLTIAAARLRAAGLPGQADALACEHPRTG